MSSFSTPVHAQDPDPFVEANTVSAVREALSDLPQGAVVFLDVDDTLITPLSLCFRYGSPYRLLIDDLKAKRDEIEDFEGLLSHWRLKRKAMLVSPEWPSLLQDVQTKTPVYGLTKMETGSFGEIPSVEEWRYQELTRLGLSFTPTLGAQQKHTLIAEELMPYPAVFYHGILITGSYKKSDLVREFLRHSTVTQVVLVDDREEHLKDVAEECQRQSIPFLGILFKGVETLSGKPNPQIVSLQREHLVKHHIWLEDEEAEAIISQN